MNATKRKFNALLQGIGTGPPSRSGSDKKSSSMKSAEPAVVAAAGATAENDSEAADRVPRLSPHPAHHDLVVLSHATPSIRSVSSATDMRHTMTVTSSLRATRLGGGGGGGGTDRNNGSPAAELEFLAKRRRIAAASALNLRAASSKTAAAAATPAAAVVLRKTVVQLQQPAQPQPRYCPGDRQQLLRRLGTFQELTDWTPKPDRINEIEWAKRGWACQGKERLRCTLCSREVVVKLKPDASSPTGTLPLPAAEDALVDRYADAIVAGHQDDCLWRRKGCDDHLLRLPLASPAQAVGDLRQRYEELVARRDALPYECNLRLPPGLDLDAILRTLPTDFFDVPASDSSTTPPAAPNRVALALAMLGWQGLTNSRIGAVNNSASCQACLRRLGLWMFKSKQLDAVTGAVLEPAPMDSLDGVREHRFFCPWKNGQVQRNPGAHSGGPATAPDDAADVPGWLVLVQVLRNDTYLRTHVTAGVSKIVATDDTSSPQPSIPVNGSATSVAGTPGTPGTVDTLDEDDDEATRAAKDKERWARLRRVKSLFDPKGASKFRRRAGTNSSSRPGSSHSRNSQAH